MDTFQKRVLAKKESDALRKKNALDSMYRSLQKTRQMPKDSSKQEQCAKELLHILTYFGIQEISIPADMQDAEECMGYVMGATGIMRRRVVLSGDWWKDGAVPLLCSSKEGTPIALLPAANGGYEFLDVMQRRTKVTEKNAELFLQSCYCFYQPFDKSNLSLLEFCLFLCKSFCRSDVVWLLAVSLCVGLAGMSMPMIYQFIFHSVIPSGTTKEMFGIAVLIFGTIFIQAVCRLWRALFMMRIGNKMEVLAKNAVWGKILSLPAQFFRSYSSGELAERAAAIDTLCNILGGQLIPAVCSMLFSFLYFVQMYSLAPELLGTAAVVTVLILVVQLWTVWLQLCRISYNTKERSVQSGQIFQYINGITKIKLTGAEVRVFEKWAKEYAKLKLVPENGQVFLEALGSCITFGGTIVLYVTAYQNKIQASEYIAFHSAFTLFLSAVLSLVSVSKQAAALKPAYEMLLPILQAEPENEGYKKQIERLSGDIELSQIKFRYREDLPFVLDGLQLHIKAGEYIGIVGASGSGKSTLMRILLGFEKPMSGSVYYDMQDMQGLQLQSVRRRIGVVLQDGKLFSGDIYSNIVICAPWLSVEQAWEAAKRAGFAEDIEAMPMGMFTMLSEGGGGLSGGQKQRLLIARALAAQPDIVMFDEATSALDNMTQEIVVKTLEEMTCTRLVIAHRLSTIKNCSRIVYLEKGKIAESGTYEELMQLNGKFAKMAKRQIA